MGDLQSWIGLSGRAEEGTGCAGSITGVLLHAGRELTCQEEQLFLPLQTPTFL
jgi:hypothetical protein